MKRLRVFAHNFMAWFSLAEEYLTVCPYCDTVQPEVKGWEYQNCEECGDRFEV